MVEAFTWGAGGEKQSSADRRRRVAEAMVARGADTSPVQHWSQGAARVVQSLLGGMQLREADAAEKAGQASLAGDMAALSGGTTAPAAAPSFAASGAPRSMAMPNISPEMKTGIAEAATALGISPVDLATTISYETGGTFDPTKSGPTTKWGQHRGLIQFGEPQAKQYGVDWSNPAGSQLGANGAIVAYLRDRGVKPGMGLMDIYSTINAGAPGLYDRSDAAAGGAPGTVADKVNGQMAGHRARAQSIFADLPAAGARPVEAESGAPGFFVPPASGGETLPIMRPGGALPNFDQDTGRWLGPSNPPAMATMPTAAPETTPPAVAQGPAEPQPLAPVFTSEGVSQPWMGSAIMPPPPEPAMAQAPQPAPVPLPPPRPADLAMPQADLPAPGAVPAVGQVAPAMPTLDWSEADPTRDDGGVRAFSRLATANAPVSDGGTVFERIAAALGGRQAPAAASSPAVQRVADAMPSAASATPSASSPAVERVAAAMPQQNGQVAAAMRVLNSPYANAGQRSVAQAIVERSLAPKNVQTIDLGNSIGVLDAGGNVVRQIPKTAAPSKPTFGKIGVDANGDDVMGFIDPEARTVTPNKPVQAGQPTAAAEPSAIPPAPPGVNGKIWREEQSKRAVENNLPASFDDTTKARNELAQRPAYKNMAQAAPIYKGMVDAAGRDNKASDLNLVYGLGKIMDPTSVVREGEMVMVKDTAALPQWLQGQISALNGGGRLTPETRRAIMQEAYGRLQSYEEQYNQDADFYRGIAKKRRMDPDEVVPGFGKFEAWQPAPVVPVVPGKPANPGQPAPVAAPKSKADYDALPSGTPYMAPDGKQRVKP